MTANVNHPKYYNRGPIEVIDLIEGFGLGFHLGNVVKYILRAGYKPGASHLEDLCKARWYLDREIERLNTKADVKAAAMAEAYGVDAPRREPASNGDGVERRSSSEEAIEQLAPTRDVTVACPLCHVETKMFRDVAWWRCGNCGRTVRPGDPGFDEICKVLNPASQVPKGQHEQY